MTTETVLTDNLSLIEQLREYADNNGYSHNDYADTMTLAANALERAIEQAALQSQDREDSARLDWIEKNARRDPDMGGNHTWWPTAFNKTIRGPSLRAAIDHARRIEEMK